LFKKRRLRFHPCSKRGDFDSILVQKEETRSGRRRTNWVSK